MLHILSLLWPQEYYRETAELLEIDKELKDLSQRKIQLQMEQDRMGGTHNILIGKVTKDFCTFELTIWNKFVDIFYTSLLQTRPSHLLFL